jgi:hypothetical protein
MIPVQPLYEMLDELKKVCVMEAKSDANAGGYGLKMIWTMIKFIKTQEEIYAKKEVGKEMQHVSEATTEYK